MNGLLINLSLIPGQKLCTPCRLKVINLIKEKEDKSATEPETESDNDQVTELEKSVTKENEKKELDSCFTLVGVSPLKLHSLGSSSKTTTGKRKLSTVISNLKLKVAKTLDIDPQNLEESPQTNDLTKDKMFDNLISKFIDKHNEVKKIPDKIQILTLAPDEWSIKQTSEMFNASEYSVRKARSLKQQYGILAKPEKKKGKLLPDSTIKLIESFYCDETNCRMMPGKKDHVSVSRNNYVQKRLLLCNLNELYSSFKVKYPHIQVKRSKFCSLRPRSCIIAGASGTHSVCVCTIHQNVILMLDPINADYKELLKLMFCDVTSKECMLGRCESCPDEFSKVQEKIFELLGETFHDEITFKQWTTTDRSNLISLKESTDDYVNLVIKKLTDLAPHSFLAKNQSLFLRERKENLNHNSMLLLGDFAENYNFMIQDEVQGFHWNNLQCTLHPVVVYFKDIEGEVKSKSYCVISDEMQHNTVFVYALQKDILGKVKTSFPQIQHIEYFTDGCPGQYKNYKNFMNLCHHEEDFEFSAEWNFFATSHGKQPCDGIGGTVKRIVAKASIQRPRNEQILTPDAMFQFCQENIDGIEFCFISKADVAANEDLLEERHSSGKTVPGTRSCHAFIPLSTSSLGMKRCSSDKDFVRRHNFAVPLEITQYDVLDYICCIYDNKWWIGVVLEAEEELSDYLIKFMHPHGPARSFTWPRKDDTCWIPSTDIIQKIDVPDTVTGRSYTLKVYDLRSIEEKYMQLT